MSGAHTRFQPTLAVGQALRGASHAYFILNHPPETELPLRKKV